MRRSGVATAIGVLPVATAAGQTTVQDIVLTPANVHWGYYDARLKPIAKIGSGARFRLAPGGGVLADEFPYAALKVIRWKAGDERVTFAPVSPCRAGAVTWSWLHA